MVRNCYITTFTRFVILFFMLYGYLISNTSNAKIGPLLYVITPSAESLYSRLQSLLRKLQRKKKALRHTQFLGFGKNITIFGLN